MAVLRPNEVIIHEGNFRQFIAPHVEVDGEKKATGLIPRPYETHPTGHYKGIPPYWAIDMPLIPESEWKERIRDKVANKSQLSDIRLAGNNGQSIPSRDQDSVGYCWCHSGVSALLLQRAVANLPYVDLSPFAVGCELMNYQDRGGWGAAGVDFLIARGVPTSEFWPQQSMSRNNNKPETWANAALHKVVEGWIDLAASDYDRNLSKAQVATCLLCNQPCVFDMNYWSHSICGMDLVDGSSTWGECRNEDGRLMSLGEFEDMWGITEGGDGYATRIWNSWSDSWSDRGMGLLTGSKAWPDGAVSLRSSTPSVT